jgi:hypothetical protein
MRLERLSVNAEVATVLGSILRHSGISEAADEAVLNKVLKKDILIKIDDRLARHTVGKSWNRAVTDIY